MIAYERMKQRIWKRKLKSRHGNSSRKFNLQDKVLLKSQPLSDAVQGKMKTFHRPFEGPYIVTKYIPPVTYELPDLKGKRKGEFNLKSVKPYREVTSVN
jgi:hypothetical protein